MRIQGLVAAIGRCGQPQLAGAAEEVRRAVGRADLLQPPPPPTAWMDGFRARGGSGGGSGGVGSSGGHRGQGAAGAPQQVVSKCAVITACLRSELQGLAHNPTDPDHTSEAKKNDVSVWIICEQDGGGVLRGGPGRRGGGAGAAARRARILLRAECSRGTEQISCPAGVARTAASAGHSPRRVRAGANTLAMHPASSFTPVASCTGPCSRIA